MKTLVFLFIAILCSACASQNQPAAEPSLTPAAAPASTPSPLESITPSRPQPSLTPIKMTTPTIFIPSPTPVFTILIDNAAIDQQGRLYASGFSTGSDLRHYAVWAGGHWIELGNGFRTVGNTLVTDGAGSLFTEILVDSEQGTETAVMMWDGNSWADITGNFIPVVDALKAGRVSSNIPITAMAVDGEGNLYAAGMFYYPAPDYMSEAPMGYVARWDGQTWTVLGQGLDMINIWGLAVGSDGKVYVSGEQPAPPEGSNCYIAQWQGEEWVQIFTGDLHRCTQSLVADQSGHLYAAGESNTSGVLIAYWNASYWTTIGSQLEGEAAAVFDMAVDRDGRLCIGGEFTAVSGIQAQNIACWDGSAWHALGAGVNERVFDLAFAPNGDLYAVGYFTEAGGLPARYAARWDGEQWHALRDR
jgi:trimeric autotransporter adhesin